MSQAFKCRQICRIWLPGGEDTTGCPKKKYLSEISESEMHMENLDRFGPCQIILDHFYTLGFFGPFGPFWTVLDRFGPFGPFWTVCNVLDRSNFLVKAVMCLLGFGSKVGQWQEFWK